MKEELNINHLLTTPICTISQEETINQIEPHPSLKSFTHSRVNPITEPPNQPPKPRKITLTKVPSQILKKDLLKRRHSQRKQKLKVLTQNNIKMFLRISSQTSHYLLALRQPNSKPKENPTDTHNSHQTTNRTTSQKSFRVRCQSAQLLSKCSELKSNIKREREEQQKILNTQDSSSRLKNSRNHPKGDHCNKQNEGRNGEQLKINKQKEKQALYCKIISNKLAPTRTQNLLAEQPNKLAKYPLYPTPPSEKIIVQQNSIYSINKHGSARRLLPANFL